MAAIGGFPGQDHRHELAVYTGFAHVGDEPGDAPFGWSPADDGPELAMCRLAQRKAARFAEAFADPSGWADQEVRIRTREAYLAVSVWPSGPGQITAAVTRLHSEQGLLACAGNVLDVDTEEAGVPHGSATIVCVSNTRYTLTWRQA